MRNSKPVWEREQDAQAAARLFVPTSPKTKYVDVQCQRCGFIHSVLAGQANEPFLCFMCEDIKNWEAQLQKRQQK
jgi:ribosomal protein S27E